MPILLARLAVEERLADAAAVAEAEQHARRTGEPLVAALVAVAHVGDASIARALARRLGVAVISVLEPEPEALREVSHDLARRYRVLPLLLELPLEGPRVLRVAMADPTDEEALETLEATTGCRIEPALASLGAIDDAIARAYRGFVTVVMPREHDTGVGADPTQPAAPGLFGGDLSVHTPPKGPSLSTQPFHQLEDEAPLELRLRALVELLQQKGVITADEWIEQIRRLLQERE